MKSPIQSPLHSRGSIPELCQCVSRNLKSRVRELKAKLLSEFRGRVDRHGHVLELALNEAEALAWESGFPQLLFPTLALEKARSVARWHDHQQAVQLPRVSWRRAA
jgi:hypothetical protein